MNIQNCMLLVASCERCNYTPYSEWGDIYGHHLYSLRNRKGINLPTFFISKQKAKMPHVFIFSANISYI